MNHKIDRNGWNNNMALIQTKTAPECKTQQIKVNGNSRQPHPLQKKKNHKGSFWKLVYVDYLTTQTKSD